MARRGRPRENRPAIDLGTAELRHKRAHSLGPRRTGWPEPNPQDAESPLGRLLWGGYLAADYDASKRMYDAGVAFAGWWMLVYPKTHAIGTLGRLQGGGSVATDPVTAEANLRAGGAVLARHGRAVLDAVINTVVYGRCSERTIEKLRTGLCRLVEWQRQERRAA